jgi:hypothetical protein
MWGFVGSDYRFVGWLRLQAMIDLPDASDYSKLASINGLLTGQEHLCDLCSISQHITLTKIRQGTRKSRNEGKFGAAQSDVEAADILH